MSLFEFPKINPIKLFEQKSFGAGTLPANLNKTAHNINYNTIHMDRDWFVKRRQHWEEREIYVQPFQVGDVLTFCFRSSSSFNTDFETYILHCDGREYRNVGNPTYFTVNGINFFYYQIPLYDFAEGEYLVQVRYATNAEQRWAISEPFEVKVKHEGTMLIEASNSYNKDSVFYEQTGIEFHFRVHAHFIALNPESDFEVFDDQRRNLCLLGGETFRGKIFVAGGDNHRIPEWSADKLERYFTSDMLFIDGVAHTRIENSTLEADREKDTRKHEWEIALQESDNSNTTDVSELGVYNYGKLPETGKFYVDHFTFTTFPVIPIPEPIEKWFTSREAFLGYLRTEFGSNPNFRDFDVNDDGELVYNYFDAAEQTFMRQYDSAFKILPYWVEVTITDLGTSTTDLDWVLTGVGERAIDWGDGSPIVIGTGNANHTYATNDKEITSCLFYENLTDISVKSGGDYALNYLDGELDPVTETLSSTSEIISEIGKNLLKFANGAFAGLDLQDNMLTTAQIDKIIIMLRDAQILNGLSQTGTPTLDVTSQTPIASPSTSNSMQNTITNLNSIWILNYD